MQLLTALSSYASAAVGIVILSVCLSVRLCFTHVLSHETNEHSADILIPRNRVITVIFGRQ